MAKGPMVTHSEYVDFSSDEDDLLGDDDLLVDNSSCRGINTSDVLSVRT